MTTLYKDPNTGGFALPSSINPITGNTATYNPNTTALTFSKPSYSNLTASAQPPASSKTVNFTTALIQMLKEAQGRNATGQAKLMKQGQDITGLGINDAARNFSNPLLAPSSGTSLGRSATSEFDPALLSIENQQKLASNNLGDFTDIIKQTGDAYEKEQDRLSREEEKRLDRIASASKAKNTFDTDAEIRAFAATFKSLRNTSIDYNNPSGPQRIISNYVPLKAWMEARDRWQDLGGSDATFESNFKRYLNPSDYKAAGYVTAGITNPFAQ